MRVKFSVHMNPKRRNSDGMSSPPVKNLVYESPHKLYVGNLAWSVQPDELRNHFSQFGTVTSTRVLHDRKVGKYRAYGFLSFSSDAERDAALSLDGTVSSFQPHADFLLPLCSLVPCDLIEIHFAGVFWPDNCGKRRYRKRLNRCRY